MLVKVEQNLMVQTTENYDLFDKKNVFFFFFFFGFGFGLFCFAFLFLFCFVLFCF